MFSVMALGALARRKEWLTHEADESLLKLLIQLLTPCLIFSVVIDNDALRNPEYLIWPPVVGFVSVAGGVLGALAVARLLSGVPGFRAGAERRTFALAAGLHNYGYIPVPLITLLFDRETLGVLFVHNVGVELALWTIGIVVLTGGAKDTGGIWRRVVNPPSVAVVLAVTGNWFGLHEKLPGFVFQTIDLAGQAAIPMGLIFVGATIADHVGPVRRGKEAVAQVTAAVALRLGVFPAAMLAAAWALPLPTELDRVMVIEAAMPAASFPIILARHYGGDPPTALRTILSTSIVGLVTVPLWIRLGMWVMELGA